MRQPRKQRKQHTYPKLSGDGGQGWSYRLQKSVAAEVEYDVGMQRRHGTATDEPSVPEVLREDDRFAGMERGGQLGC